jgi:SAM-dependent methyltransferase
MRSWLNIRLRERRVRPPPRRGSYRQAFVGRAEVDDYETRVYHCGSYDSWMWRMQGDYVAAVLDRRFPHGIGRYLDFACGSGRVLAMIAPRAVHAAGVDVSEEMLALARERVPSAALEQRDITRESHRGKQFDLVTAFRFFLNAEPDLRRDALRALHERLGDGGLLIVNLHGNPWSMICLGAVIRRVVLRQSVNRLSLPAFAALLREAGFEIQEWRGFGLLAPRVFKAFGPRLPEVAEALTRRFRALQSVCVELVVVCRKASVATSTGSSG